LLGGGRADQAAALAGEFAVALLATVAATWVSLWASPPAPRRWRLRALFPLLGRFLLQSLLGGLDIARRAFDPRLPLRPGYVVFPTRLRGARRLALLQTFSSATPGAIAAGVNAQGDLVFHCLDTRLPVAEVLARDEQHLQQLFREDASR
jgi:multicomponent Na+:H+ antiporter subunit E